MFGQILDEFLLIVEALVRTNHAWSSDMSQDDALHRIESIRTLLSPVNEDTPSEDDISADPVAEKA